MYVYVYTYIYAYIHIYETVMHTAVWCSAVLRVDSVANAVSAAVLRIGIVTCSVSLNVSSNSTGDAARGPSSPGSPASIDCYKST